MNYELAKKLKDAGFLQNGNGMWYMDSKKYTPKLPTLFNSNKSAYIPTLSELIEACGEKIESLEREDSNWLAWSNGNFESSLESEPHFGSTPEEAVAKLWLALYQKV